MPNKSGSLNACSVRMNGKCGEIVRRTCGRSTKSISTCWSVHFVPSKQSSLVFRNCASSNEKWVNAILAFQLKSFVTFNRMDNWPVSYARPVRNHSSSSISYDNIWQPCTSIEMLHPAGTRRKPVTFAPTSLPPRKHCLNTSRPCTIASNHSYATCADINLHVNQRGRFTCDSIRAKNQCRASGVSSVLQIPVFWENMKCDIMMWVCRQWYEFSWFFSLIFHVRIENKIPMHRMWLHGHSIDQFEKSHETSSSRILSETVVRSMQFCVG